MEGVNIMALHKVAWRGDASGFRIVEDEETFSVMAAPVVTSSMSGVTVGVVSHGPDSFGYWSSSRSCNPVTAWRVAGLLPKVKTIRSGYGYDTTLTSLVIAMDGDRQEDRMRECARDLDMSVEELASELDWLNRFWPNPNELRVMWDQLSAKEQERFIRLVREAFDAWRLDIDSEMESRIEAAEERLRIVAERKANEDRLIEAGLSPQLSLGRLLEDIGVTDLLYTSGIGDPGEPGFFDSEDIDREILRELIGTGVTMIRVALVTTADRPDGATAWAAGEERHPYLRLKGAEWNIVSASWERMQGQFVLTLRPIGLRYRDDSQDMAMSITELRSHLGYEDGLDRPLRAGEVPSWARRSPVRIRRGWGSFRRS